MITINGKSFPLWSQFCEDKSFIGGKLIEYADNMERAITGIDKLETEIVEILLRDCSSEGQEENIMFEVVGKTFSCSFNVKYGGISPHTPDGWITFSRPYSGDFMIRRKQ